MTSDLDIYRTASVLIRQTTPSSPAETHTARSVVGRCIVARQDDGRSASPQEAVEGILRKSMLAKGRVTEVTETDRSVSGDR
jgi:hypothetical protein